MAALASARSAPPHRARPAVPVLQRRPGSAGAAAAGRPRCSCGGGCPACRPASAASRWQLASPGSAQERAADRLARQAAAPAVEASGPGGPPEPAPAGFEAGLARLPAGMPLDPPTRRRHEAAFGQPLPAVQLHRGAQADALARSVHARALVAGPHVVLAQGQGLPHTAPGRWVLAHELAHTALGHGQAQQVWRSVETSVPQGERGQEPLRGEAPPGTGRDGSQGGRSGGSRDGGGGADGGGGGLPGPEPCTPPTEMACTEATDSPASEDATVLFDVASAALRPGVADALALLGTLWRLAGGPVRMRLDGYASVEGPCVYNWDLSCRRAQAVAGGLQQSLLPPLPGVDAASLDVLAQGESNAAGPLLAANRRVTLQLLPQPTPTPPPVPATPAECSPSGTQDIATDCMPNPHGTHLPDVGGTHTESHAFEPCLLTQAEVAASPDWCVDAQQAHGGEVCYRRIPQNAGDPGDQYCYSQNCCHNSVDAVSVVSPDSPGSNACCAPTYLQYPGHLWHDVLPEFLDDPRRVTRDILGL